MTHQFFTDRMHLTDEGISLYVDAMRLNRIQELPEEMRKHVAECDACGAQIAELAEILSAEPIDATQQHPWLDRDNEEEKRAPMFRYGIAAAITTAAIAGSLYFALHKDELPQAPIVHNEMTIQLPKKDSLRIPDKNTVRVKPQKSKEQNLATELFAANFEPSDNLEDLVSTQFRSAAIEVLSPLNGDTVMQPIRFRWKDAEPFMTLSILSNTEEVLASSDVKEGTYTLAKHLAPGLYYWKLQTRDELLFVGKFLVK